MIKEKAQNYRFLVPLAAVLSIVITYSYAFFGILYGATELLLAFICYFMIFKNLKAPDQLMVEIFVILTTVSFINGVYYGDLKSVLLLSISIILPIAISVLNIDFSDSGKEFFVGFIIGFAIIVGQMTVGFLGEINSNTLGFYCYMAMSIGFVWYRMAKKKLLPLILILVGSYLSAGAGSRNVAVILLLMLILLLLPDRFFTNGGAVRAIYIAALLYTIFAADVMAWIFEQEKLESFLIEYTERFSDKEWEMKDRILFLKEIKIKIEKMSVMGMLFGEGVLNHHGHNMFYQSVFVYGYLGTGLIYLMYIRIFEMARTLIRENGDKIAIGAFIALVGTFLLNAGDLFLIGTEACAVIPQLLMGVIMLRYRQYRQKSTLLEAL